MSGRRLVLTVHRAFRSNGIEAVALAHVFADWTAECAWRIGCEEVPDAARLRLAAICERYAAAALHGAMARRGRKARLSFTHGWVPAGVGHHAGDDDSSTSATNHHASEEA